MDDNIFCVHGGLSPELRCIDQMQTIERVQEIPHSGSYCDLMWSDPEDILDWAVSPRGAGYLFGSKATKEVPRKRLHTHIYCVPISWKITDTLILSPYQLVFLCKLFGSHLSSTSARNGGFQISFS